MAKKKELKTDGSDYWHEYRNVTYVKAYQEEEEGSYVVLGQRGDVWEVPADEFHANYKPVTPNKS